MVKCHTNRQCHEPTTSASQAPLRTMDTCGEVWTRVSRHSVLWVADLRRSQLAKVCVAMREMRGTRVRDKIHEPGLRKLTSCMNFLQTGRISLPRVALNIMTCFSCGVARKISWTSLLMSKIKDCYCSSKTLETFLPSCSSILSHSSRTKCFRFLRESFLLLTRARIRPGVPTMMWGQLFFRTCSSLAMAIPPKNTPTYR